jgi:hypothetical protein
MEDINRMDRRWQASSQNPGLPAQAEVSRSGLPWEGGRPRAGLSMSRLCDLRIGFTKASSGSRNDRS